MIRKKWMSLLPAMLLLTACLQAPKTPCPTFTAENLAYAAKDSARQSLESAGAPEKIKFLTQAIHWASRCRESFPLEEKCSDEKAFRAMHAALDSLSGRKDLSWRQRQENRTLQKNLAKLEKKFKKAD